MLELITVIGFVITLALLFLTEQGREVWQNLLYHSRRVGKQLPSRITRRKLLPPSPVEDGDRSRFVRDVTIPDGTKLYVGEKFTKIWEIQNVGTCVWENRHLQREGLHDGPGRPALLR